MRPSLENVTETLQNSETECRANELALAELTATLAELDQFIAETEEGLSSIEADSNSPDSDEGKLSELQSRLETLDSIKLGPLIETVYELEKKVPVGIANLLNIQSRREKLPNLHNRKDSLGNRLGQLLDRLREFNRKKDSITAELNEVENQLYPKEGKFPEIGTLEVL